VPSALATPFRLKMHEDVSKIIQQLYILPRCDTFCEWSIEDSRKLIIFI
jgi:hypothetical protein